jgi:transposase-like protein
MAKMMQGKFTAEFKAQVALAAISNQMTVSEIVEKYNVS